MNTRCISSFFIYYLPCRVPSRKKNCNTLSIDVVSTAQLLREGFVSLQNKKCGDALRIFQQGMVVSSQSPQAVPPHVLREPIATNGNASIHACSLELSKLNENLSPHNVFLVFDRVFLLQQDTSVPQDIASTICIYNIALPHHIRATTHAHTSTLCFRRARHFYLLALRAAQACVDVEDPDDPTLPIVMAAMNNIGHIHCHFAQTNEMKIIFESLCSLLPFLAGRQDMGQSDQMFFCSCKCTVGHCILQGAAAA